MPPRQPDTLFSLLDGHGPSNNEVVGHRSDDRTQDRSVSEGRTRNCGSKHALARGGSHEPSPTRGSGTGGSQTDTLVAGWEHVIAHVLCDREASARHAAERSSKPWTLHADEQTKNILADCPERNVSDSTAARYRQEHDRLHSEGATALEKASTRGHYNHLKVDFPSQHFANYQHRKHLAELKAPLDRFDLMLPMRF
jgi:hypothetical protein